MSGRKFQALSIVFFVVVFTSVSFALDDGSTYKGISYVEDEIIVKFKEPISDTLENQLRAKTGPDKLRLSRSLDSINLRYKATGFEPVFKNFKASRNRIERLKTKDTNQLSKQERRLLKRLARAPKGARVPELGGIYTGEKVR